MSDPVPAVSARRRIRHAASLLPLALLLGACGTEAPGEGAEDPSTDVAAADLSSAETPFVDDQRTSIDDAQAIAAGVLSSSDSDPQSESEPATAAATPEAVNPLVAATDTGGQTEIPLPEPTSEPRLPTPSGSERPAEIEPAVPTSPPEATPQNLEPAPGTEPGTDPASTPGDTASESQRDFVSTTTPDFAASILDGGTVRVTWARDPNARGYNVYRDSRYHTTVFTNEFVDSDIVDRDYYYEIESFDHSKPEQFTYVARGLTVRVRGLGRPDPDARIPNQDLLDGYDLVFADEFDTGVLDSTKWNSRFLWGPDLFINSEEQYYVDVVNDPGFGFEPFTFEDGKLVINSIPTPEALREKAKGQPYLSGLITSYDAFKFTYGYVETRARVPYGKGYWPAFWLLNAYYVDDEPEIDIMEFIGDNQDTVYHTYHYHDSNGVLRSTESRPSTGVDWTADFHTYAVDWRPGLIIYYIDGVEVHRVSDPKVSRQDMYIIANTAVGGWWAGAPDATTPFPGRYELDYIRVYRQTAPYEEGPLSDGESAVEPATQVPGSSPGHRPPFELWPEGYPGRP